MITFVVLLLILVPQVWAILRAFPASGRLALICVSLIPLVVGSLIAARKVKLSTSTNGTYHDTYYVVSHFHYFTSYLIPLVALAVLVRSAEKWGVQLPRITCALSTLLALTVIPVLLRPVLAGSLFSPPARYVEYADWMSRFALADAYATILFALLYMLLMLIALWALLRRLNHWSKGS